jgi:excisionase family DNA binding protein
MSTSPTLSISETGDVFERLAAYRGFLTARDVAKMLAISEKTVYSYVSRNMIPHYKIEANVRFRPLELAEWLRNHDALLLSEDILNAR